MSCGYVHCAGSRGSSTTGSSEVALMLNVCASSVNSLTSGGVEINPDTSDGRSINGR